MSDPYRYVPSANFQHTEYPQTPHYYPPPQPFLPLTPTARPSLRSRRGTPYYPATGSLPPVTPTSSSHIPFPSSGYDPYASYTPWSGHPRRSSWHGPLASADLAHSSRSPRKGISHLLRRHSFGPSTYQPPPRLRSAVPWSAPAHFKSTRLFINPFINAANPRRDFFFDLAPTTFAPMCLFGFEQSRYLSPRDLGEPAVYPPVTRLRIICELTPQWPIDIPLQQSSAPPYSPYSPNGFAAQQQPPISLLDVLWAIHRAMHRQITHADWVRLSENKVREITRAYRVRCGMNEREKAQGVKRVDYLLGKTRMMGLVRNRMEGGPEVMKLILADR